LTSPRSDWLEKTNEQGSNRLKSGSKPNSIGAEHNEAMGHRMTHSQGSNSVARLRRSDHLSPKYGGDGKARQCNGTVTGASVATAAPQLRGEKGAAIIGSDAFRRSPPIPLSIRFHERGALTA
jgi:hypothetical protein